MTKELRRFLEGFVVATHGAPSEQEILTTSMCCPIELQDMDIVMLFPVRINAVML